MPQAFPFQKVWAVLDRRQHRSFAALLWLTLTGAVFETLSIGLVIPALALLTQPAVAQRYRVLRLAFGAGSESPQGVALRGMLALILVYAMKTAFLAFLKWRQNDFAFKLLAVLSQRLYASYLRKPYAFHLQHNSARLIRNVVSEVDIFAVSVVLSALIIFAETLTLLAVIALVVFVEPVGALVVGAITAASSTIFYLASRSHIARWGSVRHHHAGLRLQHLQQGLGGVKEVKLLGRESDFLKQFSLSSDEYSRVGGLQNTVLEFPRLWLELLSVVALVSLVLSMTATGRSFERILPVAGLFAAAAFRIMPGVNRILGGIQALKFGAPVVGVMYGELAAEDEREQQRASHEKLILRREIKFSDVSFRYDGAERTTIEQLNLTIPLGSTVGLIGPSGAGKSTVVDLLLGLLHPVSGLVTVDGEDIWKHLRAWQDQIGYVTQSIFLTDDSLERNVAFGVPADKIDEMAVHRAIKAAQLDEFVAELPEGLKTPVGERGVRLSGGQRQRIGIARALYHDPAVLVLDEATSALDTATEEVVMQAVRELHTQKTIIIVSHRLNTVAHCDRIYRLDRGTVIDEGSPTLVLHGAQ